jgi:NAD dependent epimerase/dehydratase family
LRVLNLSSGAVYGQQPFDFEHISEDWRGAPDCRRTINAYAEGKRAAEMLCAIYEKQFGLNITTTRTFALLGPYLSLDTHFAAGNVICDTIGERKLLCKVVGLLCVLIFMQRISQRNCGICYFVAKRGKHITWDPVKLTRLETLQPT